MPKVVSIRSHVRFQAKHAMPMVRKLKSRIVIARTEHLLKCGCIIRPGMAYCQVAVMLEHKFVYEKHHSHRMCIEVL